MEQTACGFRTHWATWESSPRKQVITQKAESDYRRALAIKEKHLGSKHPDLITMVESLAILYRDRGEYAQAEEMFQRTISLTAASLGPEHPFVARHPANLSGVGPGCRPMEQGVCGAAAGGRDQ